MLDVAEERDPGQRQPRPDRPLPRVPERRTSGGDQQHHRTDHPCPAATAAPGARRRRSPRHGPRRRHPRRRDIERLDRRPGRRRPRRRILRQALQHQRRQRRRDPVERRRCLRQVRRHQQLRRPPGERHPPGEHLVRHQPRGVQVDAMIRRRIGQRLLRRHVGGGAERDAHRREPRAPLARRRVERLGDAEVGHHGAPAAQQDVLGLDVAMDHAPVVRVGQRFEQVAPEPHCLRRRERPLLEPVAQRCPFDERHRVPERPVAVARRVERHDRRVLQRRGELDLATEPLPAGVVRAAGGRVHLDHDATVERDLGRHEDAGHAPSRELPLETVGGTDDALQGCVHGGVEGTDRQCTCRTRYRRPRRASRRAASAPPTNPKACASHDTRPSCGSSCHTIPPNPHAASADSSTVPTRRSKTPARSR